MRFDEKSTCTYVILWREMHARFIIAFYILLFICLLYIYIIRVVCVRWECVREWITQYLCIYYILWYYSAVEECSLKKKDRNIKNKNVITYCTIIVCHHKIRNSPVKRILYTQKYRVTLLCRLRKHKKFSSESESIVRGNFFLFILYTTYYYYCFKAKF